VSENTIGVDTGRDLNVAVSSLAAPQSSAYVAAVLVGQQEIDTARQWWWATLVTQIYSNTIDYHLFKSNYRVVLHILESSKAG
jgi:hypothetical protein